MRPPLSWDGRREICRVQATLLAEVSAAFEEAEKNQRQTDITRAVLVP
jgi:hypothetical protein